MIELTAEAVEAAFREGNRRLRDDEFSMHDTRRILAAALPHLEGATPEWTDEERGFVETALAAADAGNAGHWPTVATYLAAEVRRLRAGEGATPAIDRDVLHGQITATLYELGAWCGDCNYESAYDGEIFGCTDCDRILNKYADAVLALIGGAQS